MTHKERAEIATNGERPPDRAVAVVADQAAMDVDELHSAVIRISDEDRMEIIIRKKATSG